MRHHGETAPTVPVVPGASAAPAPVQSDWTTLNRLLPYLWQYKWRVVAAIVFMVGAKVANVGVPVPARTVTPDNTEFATHYTWKKHKWRDRIFNEEEKLLVDREG